MKAQGELWFGPTAYATSMARKAWHVWFRRVFRGAWVPMSHVLAVQVVIYIYISWRCVIFLPCCLSPASSSLNTHGCHQVPRVTCVGDHDPSAPDSATHIVTTRQTRHAHHPHSLRVCDQTPRGEACCNRPTAVRQDLPHRARPHPSPRQSPTSTPHTRAPRCRQTTLPTNHDVVQKSPPCSTPAFSPAFISIEDVMAQRVLVDRVCLPLIFVNLFPAQMSAGALSCELADLLLSLLGGSASRKPEGPTLVPSVRRASPVVACRCGLPLHWH